MRECMHVCMEKGVLLKASALSKCLYSFYGLSIFGETIQLLQSFPNVDRPRIIDDVVNLPWKSLPT